MTRIRPPKAGPSGPGGGAWRGFAAALLCLAGIAGRCGRCPAAPAAPSAPAAALLPTYLGTLAARYAGPRRFRRSPIRPRPGSSTCRRRFAGARKWPVLILFDPRSRGKLAAELFRGAADEFGWILASSNNTMSDGPGEPNARAINAMIPDVMKRLPIDEKRIYAGGFSGGAVLAWTVGLKGELSRRRDLDRRPPGTRTPGARPEVRPLRGRRRGRLQLSADARARRDRRQGRRAASTRVLPRTARLVPAGDGPPGRALAGDSRHARRPDAARRRADRSHCSPRRWPPPRPWRAPATRSPPAGSSREIGETFAGTRRRGDRCDRAALRAGELLSSGAGEKLGKGGKGRREVRESDLSPHRRSRRRCCGPPSGRSQSGELRHLLGVDDALRRRDAGGIGGAAASARAGGDPGPARLLSVAGASSPRATTAGRYPALQLVAEIFPDNSFTALQPRLRPGSLRDCPRRPSPASPRRSTTVSASRCRWRPTPISLRCATGRSSRHSSSGAGSSTRRRTPVRRRRSDQRRERAEPTFVTPEYDQLSCLDRGPFG